MISYLINVYQGQWHKFFGHPMDAVRADNVYAPGIHSVVFTCKECGRSFEKNICGQCQQPMRRFF